MRNYARSIKLTNDAGRDAEVAVLGVRVTHKFQWTDDRGRRVRNVKFLKSPLQRDLALGDLRSDDLINGDPEIDLEECGTVLDKTTKVYVSPSGKVLHSVLQTEEVTSPDGQSMEERPCRTSEANAGIDSPLRWSGKLIRKSKAVRQFVFAHKHQIVHVNGLTYDFLYGIAKQLEGHDSLLLLGAGKKGTDPLVFQRGAKAYRGFLEGRTEGDTYCLILHLSNMELKEVDQ